MSIVPFKVLTEFKFEVGSAIASASGLQGAVDGVSNSAKDLQYQLTKVGFGLASSLGLAEGGVLSLLGKTIKQFDEIEKKQIKVAGQFFGNRAFIKGVTDTNSALALSEKFVTNIAAQANKFGLDESALADLASLSMGVTVKEGIDPMKNIGFARNILKAAPQLGINAQDATGQIFRAMGGGASQGDPAFRALMQETAVFKEFAVKIGGVTKATKAFNNLPTAEKFNMLNSAFGQFTTNAELLTRQANTLSSLFLTIKQSLFGLRGVMRPLGATIAPIIKDLLTRVLSFIKTEFKTVIENISRILGLLPAKFDILLVRLQEFASVADNFKKASIAATIYEFGKAILHFNLLNKLTGGALGAGISAMFAKVVASLGGFYGIGLKVGIALRWVAGALSRFFVPVMVLMGLFQLFSRARAIAKVEDAKAMPEIISRFSTSLAQLSVVMDLVLVPFNYVFDKLAQLVSWIFRTSFFISILVSVFTLLSNTIINIIALISGAVNAVMVPVLNLLNGDMKAFLDSTSDKSLAANFTEGQNTIFSKALGNAGEQANQGTTKTVTNIGTVNINNKFKENLQPDRIAFTLTEQLLKVSQNPIAARNGAINISR